MTEQSPGKSESKLPTWLPLALLVAVILALFYRLLAGEVLFWGLPSLQFYPWRDFAMSEFAQGRLPLWNPYNGGGAPLLANYQSALLYPPHLLYFLFSGPQMMGWLGMLHLVWAGLGMWLFARRLGLPVLGQVVATLCYPLSTTIVARFGTLPMVDVAAWLPWLILATDMLISAPGLLTFAALAGVTAMPLLAGHAQWTFYSLILAGSYALWRLYSEHLKVWRIVPFLLALMLGGGIAAAQLLPTAELQQQSQRASGVDTDFAFNFSYPPLVLTTLFNPNFYGNPGDGSYAIPGLYYENAAYIGFLPIILAGIGLWRCWRRRRSPAPHDLLFPFFGLVTVITLIFVFGKYTFVYPLLYRYVPTFNLFQAPARWWLLGVFALTMLAALATPHLKADRRGVSRARFTLVGSIGMTIVGVALLVILPKTAAPLQYQLARGCLGVGILALITSLLFLMQPQRGSTRNWTLAVVVFITLDLWWANSLSNPTVPASFYDKQASSLSYSDSLANRGFLSDPKSTQLPAAVYDQYLTFSDYRNTTNKLTEYRTSGYPNLNLLDRQSLLNNFDPLIPAGLDRLVKLLNTNYTESLARVAALKPEYPRVTLASKAIDTVSLDEAEKALPTLPTDTVIITGGGISDLSTPFTSGSAQIIAETPLDLTIQTQTDGRGYLVVADTFYPGWEATIDDQPATIVHANLNFQGVQITSPGMHIIHMTYRPRSLIIGAIISAISLIIFVACLGIGLFVVRQIQTDRNP